jgi:hypothetical protein
MDKYLAGHINRDNIANEVQGLRCGLESQRDDKGRATQIHCCP